MFAKYNIEKLLLNLNPNKMHRNDSISIRMSQICVLINLYLNLFKLSMNLVLKKDVSPLSGKNQMFYPTPKKVKNSC